VQILQLRFEVFPVGPPRHAIDPRRCVTLQCDVALSEQIDGDVMQQRGEPHCLALSRRLAHGCQPVRRGSPARCPDRGRLTAVLLGRGPSLHNLRRGQTLFVQSLRGYYDLVRLLIPVHAHRSAVACMSRSGMPCRTRMRPPRFQRKNVSTCMGSSTARGSSSASHLRGEDVAFPETELGRHLEIGPVSQLNTQPVITPVNASRLASRPETRASLRAGAIGYILPREGLAPPILSPACLAHSIQGDR